MANETMLDFYDRLNREARYRGRFHKGEGNDHVCLPHSTTPRHCRPKSRSVSKNNREMEGELNEY